MVRKTIESLYKDFCSIVEYRPYKMANKATGQKEVTVIQNQPCKLSFSTIKSNTETASAEMLSQAVKLFISPDITIKAGSKIIVEHNGRIVAYKNSGSVGLYTSHQEVVLELFDGWA